MPVAAAVGAGRPTAPRLEHLREMALVAEPRGEGDVVDSEV